MPRPADLPRNICETADQHYIVQLMRQHRCYRKKFPFTGEHDKAEALRQAEAWLEQLRTSVPPPLRPLRAPGPRPYFKACRPFKRYGDRVGVVPLHKFGPARSGGTPPQYLYIVACWVDAQGKAHNKTFQVGNVATITEADERHAYQSALAFREHWEHCRDTGTEFDPAPYKHWRTVTCYPFVPAAC